MHNYLSIFLLALTAPVIVKDDCNSKQHVDEAATCVKICENRLHKHVPRAELIGFEGTAGMRTCSCYLDRVVVVDGDPSPSPERK
jgi:hypothetical protein